MPKSPNQKLRLLLLERMFLRETDEAHTLSLREIQTRLQSSGIETERKTLYDDFSCLTQMGVEIQRDGHNGYYTESRPFETAELKLLVDAVASSRFLSERKSQSLIGKLTALAGYGGARELNRQVHVAGKAKTINESVLYHVDALHTAIRENRQIRFKYFDWSVKKEKAYHRDGALYAVSPWAMFWDDEKYYLLGYDAETQELRHYRVDKMEQLRMTGAPREGKALFAEARPDTYANRLFGMFGGREETVTLQVNRELAGVIVDRFGMEPAFLQDGETFRVAVKVALSGNFYGWVFSFGGRVRILSPASVQEEFEGYLRSFG